MQQLRPATLKPCNQTRVLYTCSPLVGTKQADVLKPEFWAHVAERLRPCDQVELIPEDMSFYMRVIVTSTENQAANVALLEFVELQAETIVAQDNDEYIVAWGGVSDRYRVIRKSDGAVLSRGNQTKQLAIKYIQSIKPKKLAA